MDRELKEICEKIRPADTKIMNGVRKIWDNKCIPLESLGWFQETVVRIAGVQRKILPDIRKKLTLVMAADNGVIREGVSQSDYHVTTQVVKNMIHHKATIALMSEYYGSDFVVADMGMKETVEGVLPLSLMQGTGNIARGPAMDRAMALSGILSGAGLAMEKAKQGYQIFATGEMGIGNTTTSAAVMTVLSGRPAAEVTGRGAGLSSEGLVKKIEVVGQAVKINCPDRQDPIDVLAKVGGLDIAGLTGIFLGAAAAGVPVVIDGFIASTAAVLAYKICPQVRDVMIASHCSMEPGASLAFDMLGLKPVIFGNLHLGEGSGAVLLFPLLDQIINLYQKLPSFEEGNIETYVHLK